MKSIIETAKEIKETIIGAFVSSEVSDERYNICKSCDQFNETVRTCKQCGCFMPTKTTISRARCPIGKWHAITNG